MYIYALCCLFVINPTVFLDTSKYVKTKPRYQSFANFPCQWMIHEVISKEAGYRWFNNAIRR